ncbi:LysR substrate-binding domain-containing protein [Kiloniella sp. EL199]|uniref:LysR substrate-binding domain-containing protein n=1 Tax=Kiloniella sp. EL199 TaxID=2107581 RepID=UPI000EA3E9EA|nr:LysR substrate-binding domain-containing protein [Kiloniella sp. EL199]
MRKLPPLNSLRAFDAVARNGSFSKAAAELCVSASAVSQQISLLEDWMGVKFLKRLSNKTILTPEGILFSSQLNRLFDSLEENVFYTKNRPNNNEIRLSILPSLASRWLISRLPTYSNNYSQNRVMVEASFDIKDFNHEEFTVAIRSGIGSYTGCHSTKLFDEYVMPVCSPDYWAKNTVSLADIGKCTLLADHTFGKEKTNLNWNTWIVRENIKLSKSLVPSQSYTDSNLTIQAAVNGEGFMLGRSILINEEIKRGTLIAPFKRKQISDWPYFIVYPKMHHPPRNPLRSFINWLYEEAKTTPGIAEN